MQASTSFFRYPNHPIRSGTSVFRIAMPPSAVFSSDVSGASAAKPAAAAPAAKVEEESSDNRYYDELLAILNKRK